MTALANKFRVAIFDQFLEAFAQIPRAQQKKVNSFVRKFRADPTAASINYEKIKTFADPNLRTVRIDQAYRAIVLAPEKGNVYVLLWVDHHDRAMAWAENKRVQIHPETGSLQVLSAEPVPAPEPASAPPTATKKTKAPPPPPALFAAFGDADLVGVGLPEALLPNVRALTTVEELDALRPSLPPEAYEGLYFLSSGESLADVREALGLDARKGRVDTEDFVAALETEATKRSFAVVEDDAALAAMLEAPLEKWRVFLHPSQRKLVEQSTNGPMRVLGGAGTGKTVVVMHRAAWLAEHVFTRPSDRILLTTFTRNLAADIAENMRKICSTEAYKRIEVVHLDQWVSNFLRGQGYEYEIGYFGSRDRLEPHWRAALSRAPEGAFPETFYREEWEDVVQAQACMTEDDYFKASRAGRGVRLNRAQRKAVWPVFAEYRTLLEEHRLKESVDAMRDAAGLLDRGKATVSYQAILVDEAQDMSTTAFTLLRRLIPTERENDIFIVGDGHQRIYRRKVTLGQAGINVRGRRGRRLKLNYRTTDEIRRYALATLEGVAVDDLDGGADTAQGYKSLMHGDPPRVAICPTFEAEVDAIVEYVKAGAVDQTCLVARTNALLEQYEAALEARGVKTYRVRRSEAEDRTAPGLRLATMHRVKGLEFNRMVIAGVNDGIIPLQDAIEGSEDAAVREDNELHERALLYVALTRAKTAVLLTCHGTPSPWLRASAPKTK